MFASRPTPTALSTFVVACAIGLSSGGLALGACAGTRVGVSAHTAKSIVAEEQSCSTREIEELAGSEFAGGARYVFDACGERVTYECDRETCERMCEYSPVPSDYQGEGELEGEYTELAHRMAAAEFVCGDIKQVEHDGGRYVMAVCGNEVVYDCGDEGCRRDCD